MRYTVSDIWWLRENDGSSRRESGTGCSSAEIVVVLAI